MKKCSRCRVVKPYTDYARNTGNPLHGVVAYCRPCMRLQNADWRSKNRDKTRATSRRWRKNHPDRINDYTRVARARRRTNGGDLTKAQWLSIKENYQHRCATCNTPDHVQPLTMDHIIPVLHGGQTTKSNIQPLCQPCNSRKSSRFEPNITTSPVGCV
jgi:5-methylcytosine-specific restriction endonuclease McrA